MAQLAALQSSCAAELAEAKIRLQKETQEWQDRCNNVEARLQDTEQAAAAQRAAHEKALGKMTAQHARKVCQHPFSARPHPKPHLLESCETAVCLSRRLPSTIALHVSMLLMGLPEWLGCCRLQRRSRCRGLQARCWSTTSTWQPLSTTGTPPCCTTFRYVDLMTGAPMRTRPIHVIDSSAHAFPGMRVLTGSVVPFTAVVNNLSTWGQWL